MGSISISDQLHFVLFPFMAQGHLIPMVDIGRLLAQRGVIVTIVTTPLNAGRVERSIAQAVESELPIRLLQIEFPEKGLPDGVENANMLYLMEDFLKFFAAVNMMEDAAERLFEELGPRPDGGKQLRNLCNYCLTISVNPSLIDSNFLVHSSKDGVIIPNSKVFMMFGDGRYFSIRLRYRKEANPYDFCKENIGVRLAYWLSVYCKQRRHY